MDAWKNLTDELSQWDHSERKVHFWWRDDDAHRVDPKLERLCRLSEDFRIPLGLATVPAWIESDFVEFCQQFNYLRILQHGYQHMNHGKGSDRAGELEYHRPREEVLADLKLGRETLLKHFPETLNVLVPPWNKISSDYIPFLPSVGLRGLSTFYTIEDIETREVKQVDCHVDIIKWKKPPYFRGTEKCIDEMVSHLKAKREGQRPWDEPTGVLSHHLDQDEECFGFLHQLFELTSTHDRCRWQDPKDLFQ